jgi:hypothetical protein
MRIDTHFARAIGTRPEISFSLHNNYLFSERWEQYDFSMTVWTECFHRRPQSPSVQQQHRKCNRTCPGGRHFKHLPPAGIEIWGLTRSSLLEKKQNMQLKAVRRAMGSEFGVAPPDCQAKQSPIGNWIVSLPVRTRGRMIALPLTNTPTGNLTASISDRSHNSRPFFSRHLRHSGNWWRSTEHLEGHKVQFFDNHKRSPFNHSPILTRRPTCRDRANGVVRAAENTSLGIELQRYFYIHFLHVDADRIPFLSRWTKGYCQSSEKIGMVEVSLELFRTLDYDEKVIQFGIQERNRQNQEKPHWSNSACPLSYRILYSSMIFTVKPSVNRNSVSEEER